MGNYTFYLKMRMKQQKLVHLQSVLKQCFSTLTFLLLATFLFAQSDVDVPSVQTNGGNAELLQACGLSLDHIDVSCAEDESGQIVVNLSTDETGTFMLNWVSGPTAIPLSTFDVTTLDPATGLFQDDIDTITGLIPGVYNLVMTTPSDDTCFAQATIFITDAIDPVITCPADIIAPNDPGQCEATVEIPIATAEDSCGVTINVDVDPFITVPVNGSQTVTYIAMDTNGNMDTCSIEVMVVDLEPPTITCPGTINISTDDDQCNAVATWMIDADDNCGIDFVNATCVFPDGTEAPCASGDEYPLGTTIVVGNAVDVNGNSSQCDFQIIVGDNEDPVVNCPADITVSADAGECGAVVNYDPTATDNCGVVSNGTDIASGTFFTVADSPTTVTYTATDAAGNSSSCTFTVTVVDNEPPALNCPADVVMNTSASGGTYDCEATVPDFIPGLIAGTDGSFSDNCTATPVQSPAPGTAWGGSHQSTQDVVITVTDASGNVTTCSLTLTLEDNENPEIDCPSDITVDANDNCEAIVSWDVPPTNDNCAVASVSSTHNPGDTLSQGTTTVTYTVVDVAGLSTSCSFDVTVIDDTPPVPVCDVTNVSVVLSANADCEAAHVWVNPVLMDNCENTDTVSAICVGPNGTEPCSSGYVFPLGTTDVTYNDAAICDFTVTIEDNTPPTVDPQDVTEATGDNDFYDCDMLVPNYEDPIVNGAANPLYNATDNCDVTVTQNPAPGTVVTSNGVCDDPVTVVVTATDSAGNSATGTATLTLNDDVDPLITCPADITVTPAAGDCDGEEVTIPVPVYVEPVVDPATGEPMTPMHPTDAPTNGAYTDDCDCVELSGPDTSVALDATNTGVFPIGTTTVSYTATDAAGNTATCTFTVTVLPPDPVIVCNGSDTSSATLDADANCEATHDWPTPTLEACGSSTPLSATCVYPDGSTGACASGDTFPLGTTQITYPDASQCDLSVTVVDNTPPTVDPQDVTEATGDNDFYDCDMLVPNYEDPIVNGAANPLYNATDNCDVTVTQNPAPGTVVTSNGVCDDPVTVVVTATDSAGNSATGTATLTLNDDVDPLITCPADITVTPAAGDCDGEEVTIPVPVYVEPVVDPATGEPMTPMHPTDAPTNGAYTDDCDCVELSGPDTSVALDATNTGVFPIGTTTVSYTATDAAGNTATCTFTVTVLPPDPVIVCNGSDTSSATLDADANCEATHDWPTPTLEACEQSTPLSATCVYPDGSTGACASGDTFPLGTTQITYPDASQCDLSVTVVDNTPPTVDPQDVTEATSDNDVYDCDVVIPNYEDETINGAPNPLYTGADNCDVIVTQDPAPGTVFDDGGVCNDPITVTVTATDPEGNSAVGTATVTLNDDVDPLITCPADINMTGACEGAEITIPVPVYVEPTLDANGDPIAPTNPDDPSTGAYTDDCDCVVLSGPTADNGVVLDANNTALFPVGTTTLTYTATDAAGNTATCTFIVTIGDPDPFILCNGADDASATYDANENCEAPHTWPSPTIEACNESNAIPATCTYPDGTSAPCASGDMFPLGTTTVTFANAGPGQIPNCTFTVTVEDTPPTFDADPAIIPTSDNGVYDCGVAVPNYIDPASDFWINLEDNCGAVATQDPAPGTVFGTCHEDTQDVVITIYDDIDGDGLPDNPTNPVGTETVTVTLIDDVDPLITCPPNVVIETENCDGADYTVLPFSEVDETLDANGNPLPLDPYTYADDCSTAPGCLTLDSSINNGVTLSGGDSGTGTFPEGTTTLTYTVTDGAGNTATCTYTVTVIVEQTYTINCPSTIKVVNDEGECGADVYWNPPVSIGSCGDQGPGNTPPTSCEYPDGTTGPCGIGSFFPVGITTVSYDGTDCSFEVRVLDTEAPVLDCPDDIEISVAGQGCKVIVDWNPPAPNDNCGVVSFNGTHESGTFFPVGVTTVIYKGVDAAGNVGTCNFTITVTDNLDPEAGCPDDIVLDAPGIASWTAPNPVDNCIAAGVLIESTHQPGDFFDASTTVTYIFEDAAGNASECSFNVTVNGTTSPRMAGKVALEGALLNANGMMRDDLRAYPTVPVSFGIVTPYGGIEAISTTMLADPANATEMPNSLVDWIQIEVRDANDPTQVIMTRSALVERDGDITAIDGSSEVSLPGLAAGNYYVAIRHRNHLGIMTASPVYLDVNAPMLDFTDANFQTWGTNARVNVGGKMAMIAGDATNDGAITAADRTDVWNNRNTQSYMAQDCDMSGSTTAADRNITFNNRNIIEQLPQ